MHFATVKTAKGEYKEPAYKIVCCLLHTKSFSYLYLIYVLFRPSGWLWHADSFFLFFKVSLTWYKIDSFYHVFLIFGKEFFLSIQLWKNSKSA